MIRNFLIVAGGIGTRMGLELPKQFIELKQKPILLWTLERVWQLLPDTNIIIILPGGQANYWKVLCEKAGCKIPHFLADGGPQRFYSVQNGIALIKEKDGLTAIHDGVRPFVSESMLERLITCALDNGNAIPVIPVTDSMRFVKDKGNQAVSRKDFYLVQTPQVFSTPLLEKAYNQAFQQQFTDDASVVENTGTPIHLVEGEADNIKITRPLDLVFAEALICKDLS